MDMSPFIYTFCTPKSNYIYDFNSNAILRVNDELFNALKESFKIGEMPILNKKDEQYFKSLLEMGFFQNKKWIAIKHPSTSLLKEYLNSSISALTLQVTQNCNLRCEYCPYSGGYNNRSHNSKKMDFETAKRAVDFYIKHSYDLPNLNISFYGGEPLLEFSLIKQIVEYVKIKGFGKEFKFRMTTNATLMNDEIIRFLVENNFNVTISLDGPKELHDRYRKTTDGKGSYETIMEKIEYINKKFPQFVENILINCVIDPGADFGCLNNFFTDYEEVNDYMTNFNTIAREELKDETKFLASDLYIQNYNFELFKMFMSRIDRIDKTFVSKIVQSYYSHMMSVLAERNISMNDSEESHPGGPCIPGSHKLFVDIHGKFYPCEKLNECSNDVIIGDLDKGFNIENVEKILNIGNITEDDCKNCWCSKFCYLCVLYSQENGEISKEKRKSHCHSVKKETESLFRNYCLVKEVNEYEESIYFLQ